MKRIPIKKIILQIYIVHSDSNVSALLTVNFRIQGSILELNFAYYVYVRCQKGLGILKLHVMKFKKKLPGKPILNLIEWLLNYSYWIILKRYSILHLLKKHGSIQ